MKKARIFKDISLTVTILKEGDSFIAYAPSLDLSTYGTTLAEAKKNFEEVVELFFDELDSKETTEEVLSSLGWTKKDKKLTPPIEVEHKIETFRVPVYA